MFIPLHTTTTADCWQLYRMRQCTTFDKGDTRQGQMDKTYIPTRSTSFTECIAFPSTISRSGSRSAGCPEKSRLKSKCAAGPFSTISNQTRISGHYQNQGCNLTLVENLAHLDITIEFTTKQIWTFDTCHVNDLTFVCWYLKWTRALDVFPSEVENIANISESIGPSCEQFMLWKLIFCN